MAAQGTAVFGEAVAMVADALGVELDEIVCEAEYAQTTEDVVMDSWTIAAGCVAGVAASWQGRVGDRTVVELNVRWKKGQTLDPDWPIEEGHVIQVDGRPTVRPRLEYLPPPDFEATTFADFMVLGMIMTAMPADQRHPLRGRRAARASSPTPTCRCRCPAASCRLTPPVPWPSDPPSVEPRDGALDERDGRVVPRRSRPSASFERQHLREAGHHEQGDDRRQLGPRRCRGAASAARIASTCAARNRSA